MDDPCPICHLTGGFHDVDDEWSDLHRRTLDNIPRELIRPTSTSQKEERKAKKQQEYQEYLKRSG